VSTLVPHQKPVAGYRPRATQRYLPPSPPAWRPRASFDGRPPLGQFIVLSILLHMLAILIFGAPRGGSREGHALFGSLDVVIADSWREPRARPGPGRDLAEPRATPLPPLVAPRAAPEVASRAAPGITPAPAAPPKLAPAPEAVAPPAETAPEVLSPVAVPPLLDRIAVPDRPHEIPRFEVPPPAAARMEVVPPIPTTTLAPITAPRVERQLAEPPKIEAPAPPPVLPRIEAPPIDRVQVPRVERQLAEPPKIDAPAPPPVLPRIEAPPIDRVQVPRVERQLAEPPKIEAPAPPPVLPRIEAPPIDRVQAPRVERQLVQPPKLEAPALEAPKVEAPKVEAPKVQAPEVEAPKAEAPRAAPPAAEPSSPRAPSSEAARPLPGPREAPIESRPPESSPFRRPPASEGQDYDPTAAAPALDADAMRRRAGELARQGTGNRALLAIPMPPVEKPKTTLESAIEKARKPDCRTAYQGLGLLAAVPLIANEFGEGTCRW